MEFIFTNSVVFLTDSIRSIEINLSLLSSNFKPIFGKHLNTLDCMNVKLGDT